jgi:hypothetical protein
VTKAGVPLQGDIEWNTTKDVLILRTFEILPPQSELKASVKVFWEKKSDRGVWESIKDNGQVIYETKETTFTTGTAPNFIPEENIAYSHPVKNQYNMHLNESPSGYVKLKMGQSYLFEPGADGTQWNFMARFQDMSGKIMNVPLTYSVSQKNVSFNFPAELTRQSIYKMYFIKRPVSSGPIDQNLERADVAVDAGEGNETTVTANTLEGSITNSVEKDIYKSVFRTSQFGTFSEKWATLNGTTDLFDVATGYVAVIGKRGNIQETFDEIELLGKDAASPPLVQVIASSENDWFKNTMAPLLYNTYPIDPAVQISWRDPAVLGVKPLKGVHLRNSDNSSYRLEDSDVTGGSGTTRSGAITIGYFLSWYSFWDYSELKNKTAAKYLNNWGAAPPAAKTLLGTTGYTDLLAGYYPVELTYSLPGPDQVKFKREVLIKF